MSDPAVLAVNRAMVLINYKMSSYQRYMIVSLEALKPIREIVTKMDEIAATGAFIERDLYDPVEVLKKLCFTTEEIKNA